MKIIKEKIFNGIVFCLAVVEQVSRLFRRDKNCRIGFVVEEFFHKDLRGFGGFGMTVKNLTSYFNSRGGVVKAGVLLSSILPRQKLSVKQYHNTDVILREGSSERFVVNFMKYFWVAHKCHFDLLISIDWYSSYIYPALSLPNIPLVIWLHDPRAREEWERIATVPLEMKVIGKAYESGDLKKILDTKLNAVRKIIDQSRRFNRKLFFAMTTPCLIERAKRSYDMAGIDAFVLPIAIEIPEISGPHYSEKPSFLFLGRLEPCKRPWVFCELAKRFPDVDFWVAGISHFPDVVNPVLEPYKSLPNLKFLGLVEGEEKHKLLNSAWAIINTSVHEAQPVSFLEAFSYYKPVISCQDPDNIVSRYGWYVGEILGMATDKKSLDAFSVAIQECLTNRGKREEKGFGARRYVEENNSYKKFEENLNEYVIARIKRV
jgi:glycosyltransferase involved in cell wall biosynthesis